MEGPKSHSPLNEENELKTDEKIRKDKKEEKRKRGRRIKHQRDDRPTDRPTIKPTYLFTNPYLQKRKKKTKPERIKMSYINPIHQITYLVISYATNIHTARTFSYSSTQPIIPSMTRLLNSMKARCGAALTIHPSF